MIQIAPSDSETIASGASAPAVSCVIPCYENLPLFSRCLMSIVTQQGVDLEVIVSDDSRSAVISDFVALLQQQFPSIRYVAGPRTGNPVENWNNGLDASRGRHCIIIHHDEFLVDPNFLRDAVDRLDQGMDVVVGRCCVIGVARSSRIGLAHLIHGVVQPPPWMLYGFNWIGATACIVFRSSPTRRFDPALTYVVDVEFYVRLLSDSSKVDAVDRVVVGSLAHHSEQITAGLDVAAVHLRELKVIAASSRLTPFQWKLISVLLRIKCKLAGRR